MCSAGASCSRSAASSSHCPSSPSSFASSGVRASRPSAPSTRRHSPWATGCAWSPRCGTAPGSPSSRVPTWTCCQVPSPRASAACCRRSGRDSTATKTSAVAASHTASIPCAAESMRSARCSSTTSTALG
ncbi:hypothetical protein ACFPRL_08715 [Pseudoclavibacter helvolus]